MALTKHDIGCCCGGSGCNAIVCVTTCVTTGLAGATVTIKTGAGVTVASGTTDATGCVTLAIGTANTYTATVSAANYTTRNISEFFSCGGSHTYNLTPTSSWVCPCSPCTTVLLPSVLTGSDGMGSFPLTASGGSWFGCAMRPYTGCTTDPVNCSGSDLFGSGTMVPVRFIFACGTTTGNFSMAIQINICANGHGPLRNTDCTISSGATTLMNAICATGPPTSCSPFDWGITASVAGACSGTGCTAGTCTASTSPGNCLTQAYCAIYGCSGTSFTVTA